MSLFAELKRRKVLRVAGLYVVASWLVMQVAEFLIGLGALPESTGQWIFLLLTIGYPIALIFSWFFDIRPRGVVRDADIREGQPVLAAGGRRTDFVFEHDTVSELSIPFPAYEGDNPYVFVCYAHSEAKTVYGDLLALNDHGINLWYDEGIPAGKPWRAEIAGAIQNATRLLFFISKSSLASAHCLREVDYALDHDIDIVPVYLDDAQLPGELALALNRVQALFRKSDARYIEHLVAALRGAPQAAEPRTGPIIVD
jgi:hypothetical protein